MNDSAIDNNAKVEVISLNIPLKSILLPVSLPKCIPLYFRTGAVSS